MVISGDEVRGGEARGGATAETGGSERATPAMDVDCDNGERRKEKRSRSKSTGGGNGPTEVEGGEVEDGAHGQTGGRASRRRRSAASYAESDQESELSEGDDWDYHQRRSSPLT